MVTAAHCVDGLEIGHGPDILAVSLGHGAPIPAKLVERADSWDLALIKLSRPMGNMVRFPWASRCSRGDGWFAPSRPTQSDPELDGHVTGQFTYECFAGDVIEAIQLTTQAGLGNYEGYSGGPVFLLPEDSNRVIGILIEQYPDRVDTDRAGGTLFAAAIEGVIEQFDRLSTAYLLRWLVEGSAVKEHDASRGQKSAMPRTGAPAVRKARIVVEWTGDQGVIDPEVRAIHQALINKWVAQHGDEAGEI
jgi:hypothetical protein